MDLAELKKLSASLSPEERAAIFGGVFQTTALAPWKWNHLADAVPDSDVARVVNACRAAVRVVADNPDVADADTRGLAEIAPALAAGVVASAQKRGKSIAWSLGRVCDYLQSEAAATRRAAAARRVPPEPRFRATPEAPAKGGDE